MGVVDAARPVVRRRPPRSARRAGYAVAGLVNGLLLWLANVEPGWRAVPFLSAGFDDVLPLVNASLVAGLLADVVYLAADPPRLRAAGDVVVTAVGLAALIALWRTFPFAFFTSSFDWAVLVRLVLALGVVGSVIGIGVAAVTLVLGRRPGG